MQELTIGADVLALPSFVESAELYRRRGGYRRSYRKNVCFITMNGSWNEASFLNFGNGFGGF